MKKTLFVLAILGAILIASALNFHLIILDDDFKILKKADLTFTDTVVDARGLKMVKLFTKPNLIRAGIKELLR